MGFTRRVARIIIWVGGTALILAAAVSLAQGSSPTEWDLQHVVHLPEAVAHLPEDLSHLQDRIGQDIHAAADAIDPYWHAAADAVDPYWHAAVDAADPYIKTATDNIKTAAEVVDPYLHGAMGASKDVLNTAVDAAGEVVRQGIEVMKPYVDDEMYEMMTSAAKKPWGMGETDGEEEEGGGGGGGGGDGFGEEQNPSQSPEGESTLGQWVGRQAEKVAIIPPDDHSSSPPTLEAAQTRIDIDMNFHDVGALAMPMPVQAPKPFKPKPRKPATTTTTATARSATGRTCARAFMDDGNCKKVVKLPECAGNPYGGKFWTVSKAAVKADPNNRFFKGLSSTVVNSLPQTSPFDGEPFESCALVSSSRDMLKRKQGALIDSHAVVMRINGAPTKGYEQYVGKRTTFRFTHSGYFGWREKPHEVLVGKWPGGRSSDELRKMAKYKVHAANPQFVQASRSAWFTKRGHLPTQGMRALLLLLGSCKEVNLFGFEGGTQWYFDKIRNRQIDGPLGKKAHGWARERRQWPKTEVLKTGGGEKSRRRRELLVSSSAVKDEEHRGEGGGVGRRLLAGLPTTHIIKVERECMNQFVKAGLVKKPK